jgi:PKD repeat protein
LCANGLFGTAGIYVDLIHVGGPVIDSAAVTTGACNAPYSYQATADADNEVTWSLTVAPAYLSISATGLITGTPTGGGNDDVTVQAETSAGTGTQSYVIAVQGCGGSYRVITGGEENPAEFVWYYGDFPEEPPDDTECDVTTLTITFEDKTIVEGSALSYIWDFGDGTPVTVSSSSIVVHTFPEFEEYTITLALMLSDGSIFRQEQTLKLGECVPLFLGEPIQNIVAGIIASAVVLWMTFILTRRRPVMIGALLATLIGVSGWTLLLGI